MRQHLVDGWHTLVPEPDDPHGPLPLLLVLLTVVTGLVDAFSYLLLGHAFVANMTGNVVFIGFAIAGAPGFVWWTPLLAIAAFAGGAIIGSRVAVAAREHRARHLAAGALAQSFPLAFAVFGIGLGDLDIVYVATLIVLLGISMGIQNATVRSPPEAARRSGGASYRSSACCSGRW